MELLNGIVFTHDSRGRIAVVSLSNACVCLQQQSEDSCFNRVWVVNRLGMLGFLDAQTSECHFVGNLPSRLLDIAMDSKGCLYGVDAHGLYRINKDTAELDLIGKHNLGIGITGTLVFGGNDALFAVSDGGYSIDPMTGALIYSVDSDIKYANRDLSQDISLLEKYEKAGRFVQLDLLTGKAEPAKNISANAIKMLLRKKRILHGTWDKKIYTTNSMTGVITEVPSFLLQGDEHKRYDSHNMNLLLDDMVS